MRISRFLILGAFAAVAALGATAVSADMRDRSCMMNAEAVRVTPQPEAAFEREARAMAICIVRKTNDNLLTRYIAGPTEAQFRIVRNHLHDTVMTQPEVAVGLMIPFIKASDSGRYFIHTSTGKYTPERDAIIEAAPPRMIYL